MYHNTKLLDDMNKLIQENEVLGGVSFYCLHQNTCLKPERVTIVKYFVKYFFGQ